MNLPKDWLRKPDWLDRANEPGGDYAPGIWLLLGIFALAACVGGFAWSLLG